MGIPKNMMVLSFLNRVLTSLRYQSGYCGYEGSQRYHYGRSLLFVAPKFRLQKKLFFFACSRVVNFSGGQYGSEKPCVEGVLGKKIF